MLVLVAQGGKKAVIFHSTLYDGAWERAAMEACTPIFSITPDQLCSKLAIKTIKNVILDDWKRGQGRSAELGVKFVPTPPSLPETAEIPELVVCKAIDENTMAIPTDIRQRWLRDPLRSKEWRDILGQFDKMHVVTQQQQQGMSTGAAAAGDAAGSEPGPAQSQADFWAGVFPGSKKKVEDLENGHVAATFPLSSGSLVCKVIEGPEFYLCATTAAGNFDTSEPIFTHGGGAWLLESKAAKALEDGTAMMSAGINWFQRFSFLRLYF